MKKNNKILIIYGSLNSVPSPEGAAPAKVIEESLKYLDKETFNVLSNSNSSLNQGTYNTDVFKHVKPTFLDKLLLSLFKIRYRYFGLKKLFITAQDSQLLYFIAVSRYVRRNNYKKIIIHVSPGLVQMVKILYPSCNIIFYHHGTSLHTKLNEEQWMKLLYNVDAIFGVNQAAFEMANSIFKTKINSKDYFKIANGVEPVKVENIKEQNDDTFKILFSGRICKEKGVLELIKAYKRLKEKNYNISLIIAGHTGTKRGIKEGDLYLNTCKEFMSDNNLEINFTGFLSQQELYKWYQRVNVLVLPTDPKISSEGMSLSLLEAMSLGKPLIATKVGGNPEVIEDEFNGFLIHNSEDYAEEIAEKIEQIYLNKELENQMIKNALDKYNGNFTAKIMSQQLLKNLKSINYVD